MKQGAYYPSNLILLIGIGVLAACWALLVSPFSPLPGRDASALTGYAGLQPFRPMATPLWGALIASLAQTPLPLAKSTVFAHALMGAATALLLAWIMLRLPTDRASKSGRIASGTDHRQRRISALIAALSFIFSASFPLTYAYPRPEALSLLLLLGSVACTIRYLQGGETKSLTAAALLLSASAIEHAAAVLIAPLIGLAVLARAVIRRDRIAALLPAAGAAAALVFAVVALAIYIFLQSPSAQWREATGVGTALKLFWQEYMARGPRALPRVGWLAIFALAFLPLPFVLAYPRRQVGDKALRCIVLPIVGTVILFDLVGAPLRVAQTDSSLPLVYATAALWIGRLCGQIWRRISARRAAESNHSRIAAAAWLTVVFAALAAAGALNRGGPAARIAREAAALAQEALADMPDDAWIITTGEMDDHLLLRARNANRTIRVLNLRAATRKAYQRYLATLDPRFDPEWIRLSGVEVTFAQWMRAAADHGRPVRALASLDLYAPPGFAMRPARLAYALKPLDATPDEDRLLEWQQAVRSTFIRPERLSAPRSPSAAAFSSWMRAWLARYGNELGVEWFRIGSYARAMDVFETAAALDPSNPAPVLNQLLLMRRQGREPSVELLEAAERRIRALPARGGIGFQLAFGRLAVEDPSMGAAPSDAENAALSPMERYLRHASAGREEQALAELDALLAADPENIDARRERFGLLLRRREFARARADLAALQRAGLPPWAIQLAEGQLLIEEGRYDEAAESYRAITLRHGPLPDAFLGLALALDRAGRIEDWKRVLPDLDRVASNHVPSLKYLADNAAANRDWRAARRYWERASELEPAPITTLENLLRLDFLEQNADKLAAHARDLLRHQPYHAMAWYALATASALRGDLTNAAMAYEIAARDADTVEILNDWGWVLYQLGQIESAREKLLQATEKAPASARAWATRGKIELDAGRPADAVQSLTRALGAGARLEDVRDLLEQAYRAAGDLNGAARIRASMDQPE